MYESVLKMATDNPDFSFKLTNKPLPVLNNWRLKMNLMQWAQVELIVCLALSIPMCIIVS